MSIWITRATIAGSPDPSAPLAGKTFAVKDNIDVAGVPTTAACPAFAYTPSETAPVVERLLAAGASCAGKTNLDQFATGLVGQRSPYGGCSSVFNESYVSGGSSSGSAVAVATGEVDFALGTDTAGSGRVPAAFNSIVGFKPTRGLLSTRGVVPACRTLDCVSIFARSTAEALAVFDAAAQFDEGDPYSRPDARLSLPVRRRYGVPPSSQLEFFGDEESAALYRTAVSSLDGEVVEIDFEPFRRVAQLLYSGPWVAERLAAIGDFFSFHAAEMHPVVRQIIAGAGKYTAVDAFKAQYELAALRRVCEREWSRMDVLVLPTAPTIYTRAQVEANPIGLNTNLGYYTNFVNLLDLCALAVPAGFRSDGLPFGVSHIAPAFTDRALLGAKPAGNVEVAVVGAHLRGQPLHWQLTQRNAELVQSTRTSPQYRLYALANTTPPKPGLVREPGFAGPGIEVEVWSMTETAFGSFVAAIPPPLGIGTVTLENGSPVKCFICEPHAVGDAKEITHLGGWRAYLSAAQ